MKDFTPRLSIVVPCYNEAENIPFLLRRFAEIFREEDGEKLAELIIVDNSSCDATAAVLTEELGNPAYRFARTVFEPQPGYGIAIRRGLSAARGEVLAWTHADLQTDPRDVFRAYHEFRKYESEKVMVKGKRVGRPFSQVIFSFGMAAIASAVLGKVFFEINAQPKLFPRRFLEYLKNAPDDFSLDLYLLYQAKKLGYVLHAIDVQFMKRLYGESKWAFSLQSKAKTVLRTVRYIFALRHTIVKKR